MTSTTRTAPGRGPRSRVSSGLGASDYVSTTPATSTTAVTQRVEQALKLARLGYYVHPLKRGSKAPATKNGHLDATRDPERIARMFRPTSNIGIALKQSGLIVVGPDSSKWLAEFEQLGLPATLVGQTGSGPDHRHYVYRLPPGGPIHRLCISGEYDVLSDGYVVAPPSTTAGPYTWLTPLRPVSELPYAPAWAVEWLQAAVDKEAAKPAPAPRPTVPLNVSDEAIIERARSAANGEKFSRLFDGDLSAHDGRDTSHSGADLALLSLLSFWSQDEAQIARIFERSGLYRPDHWRGTYRASTLKKALNRGTFYEPPASAGTITGIPPAAESSNSTTTLSLECGARVDQLEALVADLQAQLSDKDERLRDKDAQIQRMQTNHHMTVKALTNKSLGITTGSVGFALLAEARSQESRGQLDEDGWFTIFNPAVAEVAGVGAGTVSNKCKTLVERGIIEHETFYVNSDRATGEIYPTPKQRSRVRFIDDLETAFEALGDRDVEPKKHGGPRPRRVSCPTCPGAAIQTRVATTVACVACGEILAESVKVTTSDNTEDADGAPSFQLETIERGGSNTLRDQDETMEPESDSAEIVDAHESTPFHLETIELQAKNEPPQQFCRECRGLLPLPEFRALGICPSCLPPKQNASDPGTLMYMAGADD